MKRKLYLIVVLFAIHSGLVSGQDLIKKEGSPVIIKGEFAPLQNGDSVKLLISVLKYGFYGTYLFDTFQVGNKPFEINLGKINQPSFMQLGIDSGRYARLLTNFFLIEPGDTIILQKNGKSFSYSGAQPQLMYLQKLFQIGNTLKNKRWPPSKPMKPTIVDYRYLDSVTQLQMQYLASIRDKISHTSYCISKINVLASNQIDKRAKESNMVNKDNHLKFHFPLYQPDPDFPNYSSIRKSLEGYDDPFFNELRKIALENSGYLPYSIAYATFVELQYKSDSCVQSDRPFDFEQYYLYLKTHFSGLVREKLVLEAINRSRKKSVDLNNVISDALTYVTNEDFRRFLLNQQLGANGKSAYKFALPDMKGNIVRLDSLKGKVVVLDFWFTGCIYCIALQPKLEIVEDRFSNNPGVVFVSINVDKEREKWLKSVKEGYRGGHYTSTSKANLLNLYTDGLGESHPLITYHQIHGYPTLLMIDQRGNTCIYPVDPRGDNGKAMSAQITELLQRK